jgi:hypothetical protein
VSAAFTRRSGSSAFSVPKRAGLDDYAMRLAPTIGAAELRRNP